MLQAKLSVLLYLIVYLPCHIVATLYFVLFVTFYNIVFDKQCKRIMFCVECSFILVQVTNWTNLVCTLLKSFAQIYLENECLFFIVFCRNYQCLYYFISLFGLVKQMLLWVIILVCHLDTLFKLNFKDRQHFAFIFVPFALAPFSPGAGWKSLSNCQFANFIEIPKNYKSLFDSLCNQAGTGNSVTRLVQIVALLSTPFYLRPKEFEELQYSKLMEVNLWVNGNPAFNGLECPMFLHLHGR